MPSHELCILGRACPRRASARVREYADENAVLQTLRDEGLIQKPQLAATGGVSFEVVSIRAGANPEASGRKLPPIIQMEKLGQRSKRRKLTKETIHEKLIKAEQRRKQQEEEKLSRILVRPKTACLREEAEKLQDSIRTKMDKKMDLYEENRQKQLQELQERIQLKRQHSAKVRLRKMLNPVSVEEPIPEEEA
uniref:Stathmin n=1 Tax=Strigamia maritima TaxID=126957 RepID=T1IH80_STRMM